MKWHVATKVGLLVGAMLLAAACGGDSDPDTGDDPTPAEKRPGMGESTEAPQGNAFTLPAGLEWVNPTVKGYNSAYTELCDDKDENQGKGSGDLVRLCLALRNNTGAPIRVTFPPGLIFVSTKKTTQNGILVQSVTIEVPPSPAFYVPLFLYCLNSSRTPSLPDDDFSPGPVTQYQDFKDFFSLLSSKTLQPSGMFDVQHAVWHLADGEGLTQEDRDAISKL